MKSISKISLYMLLIFMAVLFPIMRQQTDGSIYIYTSSPNQSLVVSPNGNVGIGSLNPLKLLHLKNDNAAIRFENDNAFWDYYMLAGGQGLYWSYNGSAAETMALSTSALYLKNSGIIYSKITATNGYTYFNGGNVGIGTAVPNATLHVSGNVSGQPVFIAENSSAPSAIFVSSNGWIGIGTPTPSRPIDFINNNAALRIYNTGTGTGYHAMVMLDAAGAAANFSQIRYSNQGTAYWANGLDPSDFYKYKIGNGINVNINTRFTLDTTGNVGIGITTPSALLHVSGNTYGQPILIAESGAARNALYVSSNGQVGIGTASPRPGYSLTTAQGISIISPGALDWSGGNMRIQESANYNMSFLTWTGSALTEKMRIQGDGNVGIGTSNPTAKLHINAGANDGLRLETNDQNSWGLRIQNRTVSSDFSKSFSIIQDNNGLTKFYNGLTNIMNMDQNGNIGIGTTAPDWKLHIYDSVNHAYIKIMGLDTLDKGLQIGSATHGSIWYFTYRNTTNNPGRNLGLWWYDPNTSENAEKFTFTPSGNFYAAGLVGIGTTAQNKKLEISPAARTTAYSADNSTSWSDLQIINPTNTQYAATGISFIINTAQHINAGTGIAAVKAVNNTDFAADMVFITRPNAVVATERMRITSSGNVGIGTTAPLNKLHVEGTNGGNAGIYLNNATPNNTSYTLYNDSGTLKWNGTALATGASVSGTTGKIPKFTGPSSLGDSIVAESGGNIGIATSNPLYKLDVNANSMHLGAGDNGLFLVSTTGQDAEIAQSSVWNGGWYAKANNAAGIGLYNGDIWFKTDSGLTTGNVYTPSTRMFISKAGNVGIGTTNPQEKLHVSQGAIRWDNAFSGQVGLLSYSGGHGAALLYDINGTAGIDLRASGNTYFNGGNVGIGTTNPQAILHIVQPVNTNWVYPFTPAMIIDSAAGSSQIPLIFRSNNTSYGILKSDTGGNFVIGSMYNGFISFYNQNNELVRITATGNFGIGTTSPAANLHVSGNSAGLPILQVGNAGAPNSLVVSNNGYVGIGTANAQLKLHVYNTPYTALFANSYNGTSYPDGGVIIANNNNTINNFGSLIFADSDIYGTPGSVAIGAQFTDRTNHYGDFVIALRNSSGYGEKFRLTSSGNVGIGTASPTDKLTVIGTVNATTFVGNGSQLTNITVQTASTANKAVSMDAKGLLGAITVATGNSVMSISSVGNVGIGITNPVVKLHVLGSQMFFQGPDASYPDFGLTSYSDTYWMGGSLKFIRSRGTYASPTALVNDDFLGGISTWGYDGATSQRGADVYFRVDGTVSSGKLPSRIEFITSDTNGQATRMVIRSSGNVGIGTTNPIAALDVNGNIHVPYNAYISNETTFGDSTITGFKLAAGNVQIRASGVENIDANYQHLKLGASGYGSGTGYGDIRFYTTNASGQAIDDNYERMRIDNAGNVGIGTKNPTSILHINGTVGSIAGGITFGDGDSGIYEYADDTIGFWNLGAARWVEDSGKIGSAAGGSRWLNEAASSTNPVFSPGNNDETTGIGAAGAGVISFIANGTNVMNVNSNSVGIGTTNPSAELEIVYNGSTDLFKITNSLGNSTFQMPNSTLQALYNNGYNVTAPRISFIGDTDTGFTRAAADQLELITNGTSRMHIDDVGRVGIGIIVPNATLHVSGNLSGTPIFRAENASAQNAFMVSNNGYIGIGTASPESKLEISNGGIRFSGTGGFGTGTDSGLYGDGGTTGKLTLITAGSPRVTISGNGFVGIGTSTPSVKLHVIGGAGYATILEGGTGGSLRFGNGAQGALTYDTNKAILYALAGNDLSLGANNSFDQFYIKTGGNIGIGTTAPSTKLEVAGIISASAAIVNGTITANYFAGNGSFLTNIAAQTASTANKAVSMDAQGLLGAISVTTGNNILNITITGNVGIGTTNPNLGGYSGTITTIYNGNAGSQGVLELVGNRNAINALTGAISFHNTQASQTDKRIALISGVVGSSGDLDSGALLFKTADTNGSMQTRALIDESGNVGIGTTVPSSTLAISGSIAVKVTTPNADLTLDAGHYLVAMDASGAAKTVTLPSASGCVGRIYIIAKIDSSVNTVTVTRAGSDTVNGETSYVLRNIYETVQIVSLGNQWLVISK
ncbi:MAG: hypothetical protein PHV30_03555 [Candidatus Margulisbacteria bacterium]|nr:hypothetical protein [Candidatus Margulisiibacteriota bacterium]